MSEFEYPLPGEEVEITAPTAEEQDESREAWQDELAEELGNDVPQAESFESYKARKREELGGMGLAWWEDNSLFTGLGVLGKVLDSAVDTVESIETMIEVGLPAETMQTNVPVTLLSGPIILSALQTLGLFEPRLRTQIEAVMRTFANCLPEPTEEEQTLLNEHAGLAAELLFKKLVADAEASGVQVVSADQFFGGTPETDASQN